MTEVTHRFVIDMLTHLLALDPDSAKDLEGKVLNYSIDGEFKDKLVKCLVSLAAQEDMKVEGPINTMYIDFPSKDLGDLVWSAARELMDEDLGFVKVPVSSADKMLFCTHIIRAIALDMKMIVIHLDRNKDGLVYGAGGDGTFDERDTSKD